MEQGQTIQWFPGHMTKTRRKIQECLPLIDAVVEVLDARIPNSSRNPELDALTAGKPRLVVLNKADMADDTAQPPVADAISPAGSGSMAADCKSGKGLKEFTPLLRGLLTERIARLGGQRDGRTSHSRYGYGDPQCRQVQLD